MHHGRLIRLTVPRLALRHHIPVDVDPHMGLGLGLALGLGFGFRRCRSSYGIRRIQTQGGSNPQPELGQPTE